MNLNKGISTPIAILLIIAVSAVVGVAVWQFKPAPESEPTPSKSITVTSPNGGESWNLDETYDVTWNSSGLDGKVKITVTDEGSPIATVVQTSNTGSYNWNIDETKIGTGSVIQPGEKYKIKMCSLEDSLVCDNSDDYFSITEKEQGEESINLISPSGGEQWKLGETYTIEWSANNLDKVNIAYHLEGGGGDVIVEEIDASSGEYSWQITENVFPGPEYQNLTAKISVSSLDFVPAMQGGTQDESNNFTIKRE